MTDETEQPPNVLEPRTPIPQIELVDGDTSRALSPAALAVAVLSAQGHTPPLTTEQIMGLAIAAQNVLDKGDKIQIRVSRLVRPTNGVA